MGDILVKQKFHLFFIILFHWSDGMPNNHFGWFEKSSKGISYSNLINFIFPVSRVT